MVEIQLTKGRVAVVDDCDAHLARFKWYAVDNCRTCYAARDVGPRGGRATIRLHRAVLGITASDVEVDHVNGDGLDCRRSNLRTATRAQNQANIRKRSDNASGFKGVFWRAARKRWIAAINVCGRQRRLGSFRDPAAAARAYDAAAREAFGEFACLNFPLANERAA